MTVEDGPDDARPLTYVLPLRWASGTDRAPLGRYLRGIAVACDEIIVVDGSPHEIFAANHHAWGRHVIHVAPAAREACLMGKVAGVNTGVRLACNERIVVADDDVRYTPPELARMSALLDEYDLVRPQNYFVSLPWHARWDTARTLLNRALGGDFPGTLGVRRSCVIRGGGYDGDVLFENLELIRTVQARGGRTVAPLDMYVRRLPPTAAHFWGQRTRQAYDDFAIPARMICWLGVLPSIAIAGPRRRAAGILGTSVATMALAEIGRRRAGGARIFPASSSMLAPMWVLERAVCAWLALLQLVRYGGVRYGESVIRNAAHSKRTLRRRAENDRLGDDSGSGESGDRIPTSADRVGSR
jgi:Glycosyltransferase like family 2